MDHLSRHQIADAYLVAILSMACVCLFIALKFHHSWSREAWLVFLIGGWIMLELIALILFSLEVSQKAKLPRVLSSSIYLILAIMSLWGVAIVQIVAITYTFAVIVKKDWLWKCLVVLECIEVILVVILALVPNVLAPLELAYIAPITCQIVTLGVLYLASRGVPFERNRMINHLSVLGLCVILISGTWVIGFRRALAETLTQMKAQNSN
ncbi:unnamed protein product [Clonostachys solani]|uniref:Uncharacterized protein n=1 Tax=Clonostachys solani TaxID=160281 RepID=A0A9N9ZHV3_9HYPO|nr:unnamed protein product [Clonostachys solani]